MFLKRILPATLILLMSLFAHTETIIVSPIKQLKSTKYYEQINPPVDIKVSVEYYSYSYTVILNRDNTYYIPPELKGEALFQYLHKITEIPRFLDYSTSKSRMFYEIDNTICPNGKPGVWAFYSNVCINGKTSDATYYRETYDINGDGIVDSKGMNVEHIWPQSFFNKRLPMRADVNHLRPTFMYPNNKRATYPFGAVKNPVYMVNSSGAKLGEPSDKLYNYNFEPPDNVKGDVARAIFYFVMRYYNRNIKNNTDYDKFYISNVEKYIKWHKKDPPDELERKRNNLVFIYQGNRNPFIDDPSLIDRIGAEVLKSH